MRTACTSHERRPLRSLLLAIRGNTYVCVLFILCKRAYTKSSYVDDDDRGWDDDFRRRNYYFFLYDKEVWIGRILCVQQNFESNSYFSEKIKLFEIFQLRESAVGILRCTPVVLTAFTRTITTAASTETKKGGDVIKRHELEARTKIGL